MGLAIDLLSWGCLVAGAFFCVVGALGLLRLPDFYCRMHGAGIVDTMGAPLVLLGLCLQAGFSLNTVKLVLIAAFIYLSSATTGHALVRAAFAHGLRPKLVEPPPADAEGPWEP